MRDEAPSFDIRVSTSLRGISMNRMTGLVAVIAVAALMSGGCARTKRVDPESESI